MDLYTVSLSKVDTPITGTVQTPAAVNKRAKAVTLVMNSRSNVKRLPSLHYVGNIKEPDFCQRKTPASQDGSL